MRHLVMFVGVSMLFIYAYAVVTPSLAGEQGAGSMMSPEKSQALNDAEPIKLTPSIIVARVLPADTEALANTPSQKPVALDQIAEDDEQRARENRAQIGVKDLTRGLVRVKTIDVLKGPKTDVVMVSKRGMDRQLALQEEKLYLIFVGSDHPQARVEISSLEDDWVQTVRSLIDQ